MKTASLKLKQKNQFEYQLKIGAKVVQKVQAVSGGWYSCCKIHNSLDAAIEYARNSLEEMYGAFGDSVVVKLI